MSALVTHKDTEGRTVGVFPRELAWKGSVFCRGKKAFPL